MYDKNVIYAETVIAAGAVLAGRFVDYLGAQAGAGATVLGVAATDGSAGVPLAVDVVGRLTVTGGAAIAIGQLVKSDANGCATPAAIGDGDAIAGRALSACVGAGSPCHILRFRS